MTTNFKGIKPGDRVLYTTPQGQVRAGIAQRFAQWVEAMATLLAGVEHFRWHDSGDLQSVEHFALICDVARATPGTHHWLPTKEPRYVKRYAGDVPSNLVVRVSAPMVDGPAPRGFAHTSTVHRHAEPAAGSHVCPSSKQGGKCGPCRACWDDTVVNVSYPWHQPRT